MLLNLTDISDESLQSQIIRQIRAKILAGKLEAGAKHLLKAIELDPRNASRYCDYAQAFVKKNQWEKALETYEAAISLDPNHMKTIMGMGELYEEMGRKAEAVRCYRQILAMDLTEIGAAYRLVDMKEEEGLEPYIDQVRQWLQDEALGWMT